MKYAIGLNVVLLVLVSFLAACDPDSPKQTGVFLIESDKTYENPDGRNIQPKEFKGNVTGIEGKIGGRYDLGVIGSITRGKLRLNLPARLEDEYLESVPGGGDLKRGELHFISKAMLLLSKNPDLFADLFYYNRDVSELGIKKGWNFRYQGSKDSPYQYTYDIETLYAPDEDYKWLVTVIGAE